MISARIEAAIIHLHVLNPHELEKTSKQIKELISSNYDFGDWEAITIQIIEIDQMFDRSFTVFNEDLVGSSSTYNIARALGDLKIDSYHLDKTITKTSQHRTLDKTVTNRSCTKMHVSVVSSILRRHTMNIGTGPGFLEWFMQSDLITRDGDGILSLSLPSKCDLARMYTVLGSEVLRSYVASRVAYTLIAPTIVDFLVSAVILKYLINTNSSNELIGGETYTGIHESILIAYAMSSGCQSYASRIEILKWWTNLYDRRICMTHVVPRQPWFVIYNINYPALHFDTYQNAGCLRHQNCRLYLAMWRAAITSKMVYKNIVAYQAYFYQTIGIMD